MILSETAKQNAERVAREAEAMAALYNRIASDARILAFTKNEATVDFADNALSAEMNCLSLSQKDFDRAMEAYSEGEYVAKP
jgi:hypothetical protein